MEPKSTVDEEDDKPLLKKIRASILPVKPTDNVAVKFGKNLGFVLFSILFGCISLAIIIGILFAL